jgi:2-amino-4-hydroxy-6-hydroxymethyldihydropteridine diphosphokinase
VAVTASSAVYETEPVGEVLDQRAFFNAVIRIETDAGPEALLDACKAVERERGRVLAGEPGYVRHGPRPLDVDVLLLGALEYRSERLELPHREVTSRRFVLVPLVELAPTWRSRAGAGRSTRSPRWAPARPSSAPARRSRLRASDLAEGSARRRPRGAAQDGSQAAGSAPAGVRPG